MNSAANCDASKNSSNAQTFTFKRDDVDSLRIGLVVYSRLLGKKTSVAELGDGFALAKGKLQVKDIPQALKRAGLSAKIIQRRAETLKSMLLPALLILKDGSALILVSYEQGKARLILPETEGSIELSTVELEQQCSGTIIIAKPDYTPDKRANNFAKKAESHWLKSRLKACWPTYAEVGVASLIANCLTISTSLFALQVYDRVVPNDAFDTLFVLASGVIIAIILDFILRLLRSFLLDGVGKKLDLEVSSLLFNQVLQVRLSAKPQSTGAFSSQVREFEGVREFFTSSTAATISDFPFIFIFISIIAYLGGPIAWVPIIAMLLMLLPGLVLQGRLAELSRENLREGAVKHGLMLEVVENLESVKATSAEGRNLALWDSISAKLADDSIKFKRLSSFLQFGASMVQQLCYVFVVIVGVYQISAGDLTVGGLIACTMLAARTISPVNQMSGILARWQHVKVSLEGLDELMNAPVERPANQSFVRKNKLQGNYQLENTRVRYNSDAPYALNVTKLNIKAGSRIVILGSNGAGKSTLLRALAGLEDVTEGRLIVDDVLLKQIEPVDRKRWIGYLPQDTSLFYGTLRDNLLLNGAHFEDGVLLEVLNVVGLGSAIKHHPLGLDLPILGSRSLSGGQRQSVGLARLILQDPKIVLLDEPTASLDQVTEEKVIAFLAVWLKGRTLIMSTHKRKLLKLGERGIVLKNGMVTMDGPFEDLIKKKV